MFPRLRENVWHIDRRQEACLLITSRQTFNVPTEPALQFLQMRSYCTGHNSIEVIAKKSGLSVADVQALLRSLAPAGIIYFDDDPSERLTPEKARDILVRAARIWSNELRISYIGNELAAGELPKSVLIGWLLEMYHYIRDFPSAIEHGARNSHGYLKEVLSKYSAEERGHEVFVLDTLINLGMSRTEVQTSIPLLSTRLIGFLIRELAELEPAALLLMAAVIEAQEFDTATVTEYKKKLQQNYGVEPQSFDPYFKHQEVDVALGHAQLLDSHIDLIEIDDPQRLDQITNKMHDLKHAFDLQGIEIKSYFTHLNGKYVPRQPVDFSSI